MEVESEVQNVEIVEQEKEVEEIIDIQKEGNKAAT